MDKYRHTTRSFPFKVVMDIQICVSAFIFRPVTQAILFVLAFFYLAVSQRIQGGVTQLRRIVINRLYKKKKRNFN